MPTLATNTLLYYIVPAVFIWGVYITMRMAKQRRYVSVRDEALNAGLTEPASLHPLINPNRCVGCGSCVNACPEQPGHQVLGVINGKSNLINPTDCIGHGACRTACPQEAITLVFGTERRGVDIPVVNPEFETDVPGVFIAGELGGMGLIRNAIEQGRQALESVRKREARADGDCLDVFIVGAGPAGFSATLAAKGHGMRYATVEQDSLGGTVFGYPRGKLVMTSPVELPLHGKMKFTETTKEELLDFWQKVENKSGVKINYRERVEEVGKNGTAFVVKTSRATYRTKAVLLAIGRRGTPRKLGVPGEESPKVVYRLIDPEQYRGMKILVVGGGDSALEAATSIADEPGATVTLSYRSGAFSRAKEKNRRKVAEAEKSGSLAVMLKSNVREIKDETVVIDHDGRTVEIENDAVIVCAGGILPTDFLKKIGIRIETKYGTP